MVSVDGYVKQFLFAAIVLFAMEVGAEMSCPNDTYPIGGEKQECNGILLFFYELLLSMNVLFLLQLRKTH